MDNKRIADLTSVAKHRERSLAYFIWKTASSYGITKIDKQDIEDILSESYLRAITKLKNDETLEIKNYYAWLTRIVFLTTLNTLRKELTKRKVFKTGDFQDLIDTNFVVETLDSDANHGFLMDHINSILNEEERQIIHLSVNGYTSEDIAGMLDNNAPAIRKIKSRSIKKIRQMLG